MTLKITELQKSRKLVFSVLITSASKAALFYGLSCNKKLSYRKQIARQLRTQYVKNIYSIVYNSVTLKSRLGFTQGHWKWHHSTDRIRPPISIL